MKNLLKIGVLVLSINALFGSDPIKLTADQLKSFETYLKERGLHDIGVAETTDDPGSQIAYLHYVTNSNLLKDYNEP